MAYVLKDSQGLIIASSAGEDLPEACVGKWEFIENKTIEYLEFLENSLHQAAPFRESDIQLARVLEDLISLLIDKDVIRFTDFPLAAQKRLNARQSMRIKTQLSTLLDEGQDLIY